MDFPHPLWQPFNTIHTFSPESVGLHLLAGRMCGYGTGPVSGVFTANLAMYVPFRLYETATVVKMTYIVGATANGNVDVGLYTATKQRIVNSGSTAQGTANTIQELDITDTTLRPGVYFMALQGSSGTGTFFRQGNPDESLLPLALAWDQAVGSFGLPDPAAWVPSTAGTILTPLLAVHFDSTV